MKASDETAMNMGKFMRCLHFDRDVANSAMGKRVTEPLYGYGPYLVWDLCVRLGLDHATYYHKYIARYFIHLMSQTKISDQLAGMASSSPLQLPIDQIPGTVLS